MTMIAVVTESVDVAPLLFWGSRFAHSQDTYLTVLVYERNQDLAKPEEISWDVEEKDNALIEEARKLGRTIQPQAKLLRIKGPEPRQAVVSVLNETSGVKLLILGYNKASPAEWVARLFDNARVDTLLLKAKKDGVETCEHIMVPVGRGPHCRTALKHVHPMAEMEEAELTALTIVSDYGEESEALGLRQIKKALKDASLHKAEDIIHKVVVADSVSGGLTKAASEGCDLFLLGASDRGFVRRVFGGGTIPARLLSGPDGLAIGVMRSARPLKERFLEAINNWIKRKVPQLEREERVDLFERMSAGSHGGFDFIALTCMATFIASLGLIQNSTAVVIGAMLVAPLMMPMIGAGLGLIQGNSVLVRECARSIAIGFSCAFLIGFVCGLLFSQSIVSPVVGKQINNELLGRCNPGLLDLLVAFISGIAAAYANARPNLSSALPGVAIAAALVPPIATGGIAAAVGDFADSQKAVTLFGVNLVLIILGSAFAMYVQGIRASGQLSQRQVWVRRILWVFVLAAIGLAFYLSSTLFSFIRPMLK